MGFNYECYFKSCTATLEFHYTILYIIISFTYTTNYGQFDFFVFKIGRYMVTAIFTYVVTGNLIHIRSPKPLFQEYEENTNNSDV